MKKGLIFLLGIISFLGINTVSANTTTVLSHYYNYYEKYIEDYNQYKEKINHLIEYWEENYSSIYPYYVVFEALNGGFVTSSAPTFYLAAGSSNQVYETGNSFHFESQVVLHYDATTDEYNYNSIFAATIFNKNINSENYYDVQTLISHGLVYSSNNDYLIPTYHSDSLNLTFEEIKLKKGINYPGLVELKNGTYDYNIDELAPELDLEDVFSNPLDALKDVKDTIVNIFNTITDFISLCPDAMKTFLYLSFTVAIVLGILNLIFI